MKPVSILISSGLNSSSRSGFSDSSACAAAIQQRKFRLEDRLFLFLQIFFDALDPLRRLLEIVQHQLNLDAFDIAHSIKRPAFMRHRRIFKQPHHVRQRIRLAQRHQRRRIFLAILLQPADIHVLDRRVRHFLRLERLRQLRHPRVRHSRDSQMHLLGALRASTFAPVKIRNKLVFPTCGNPIIPVCISPRY